MPPEKVPTRLLRRSHSPTISITCCIAARRSRAARRRARRAGAGSARRSGSRRAWCPGRRGRCCGARRRVRRSTSWPATSAEPPVGCDERAEHVDRGRLAGAVRAEEPEDLAAGHLEVDRADGFDLAVALGQALTEIAGATGGVASAMAPVSCSIARFTASARSLSRRRGSGTCRDGSWRALRASASCSRCRAHHLHEGKATSRMSLPARDVSRAAVPALLPWGWLLGAARLTTARAASVSRKSWRPSTSWSGSALVLELLQAPGIPSRGWAPDASLRSWTSCMIW